MAAGRSSSKLRHPDLAHGVPVFIDQIIKTLTAEQRADPVRQPLPSDSTAREFYSDVAPTATLHGRNLFDAGFTIEQVIRDYGDVCQAVTHLAVETQSLISASEFRTFNRCLDDAMAAAATEYSQRKTGSPAEPVSAAVNSTTQPTDATRRLEIALTKYRKALADSASALSVAQRHARDAQLRALHDSLTGIPNRELFDDRLAHAIAIADRHGWTLAVMFLDFDQFKEINDAHGHAVGDSVLKTVAQRLLECARDEDTVCRNGGDEFLYLLMNPQGKKNIGHIADSVSKSIARPLAVGSSELVIRASIGIAIYPEHGFSGGQLITNADTAMYRAKKSARGLAFFERQKERGMAG